MDVLLLAGTTEATALGHALAGDPRFRAVMSFAGRTENPAPAPLPTRRGGFGGADGLASWLADQRIDALIDATHPFAARISASAEQATGMVGVPLLVLRRPPWRPLADDRWTMVPDMPAAAAALGAAPRRVFLTTGRQDLAPFAAAPWHHYVLRSVEPPLDGALPAGAEVIVARGPFAEAGERDLLRRHRIDVVVTKNSGGTATEAKLAAARALGLEVVMVERPPPGTAETVTTAEAAHAWLATHHASARRGE